MAFNRFELEQRADYNVGYEAACNLNYEDAVDRLERLQVDADQTNAYVLGFEDGVDELREGAADGEQARRTYDWDYGRE